LINLLIRIFDPDMTIYLVIYLSLLHQIFKILHHLFLSLKHHLWQPAIFFNFQDQTLSSWSNSC